MELFGLILMIIVLGPWFVATLALCYGIFIKLPWTILCELFAGPPEFDKLNDRRPSDRQQFR